MSTLGHAPSVVDLASSAPVEHLTDAASSLVDQFIPVSLSCHISAINSAIVWVVLLFLSHYFHVSVTLLSNLVDKFISVRPSCHISAVKSLNVQMKQV